MVFLLEVSGGPLARRQNVHFCHSKQVPQDSNESLQTNQGYFHEVLDMHQGFVHYTMPFLEIL